MPDTDERVREFIVTDFSITANEFATSGWTDEDVLCRLIASRLLHHGDERTEAVEAGKHVGVPRLVQVNGPDYDGWKFRWISEVLDG